MKTPIWKPILVAVAVALGAMLVYPPQTQLRPGIDLAGGTTFLYQINIDADEEDPRGTVAKVIEVLKDRIDPDQLMNLIWRPQGRDRIEVQIPLAPESNIELRKEFLTLRDELLQVNLNPIQLDARLAKGTVMELARTNPQKKLLTELTQSHQVLEDTRRFYDQANREIREADQNLQEALEALGKDVEDQQRKKLEAEHAGVVARNASHIEKFTKAEDAFKKSRRMALENNLSPNALEAVLNQSAEPLGVTPFKNLRDGLEDRFPDQSVFDEFEREIVNGEKVSPRDVRIRLLKQLYPDRAEAIAALVKAYTVYEKVKGELDDPNDFKEMMRGEGVLEFRIAPSPAEIPDLDTYVKQLNDEGPKGGATEPFRWLEIDDVSQFADTVAKEQLLREDPEAYFNGWTQAGGVVGRGHGDGIYLLLGNNSANSIRASDPEWKAKASNGIDQMGFRAVNFAMSGAGPQLMGALTNAHVGKPMAIALDGRVISAPSIREGISDRGIIEGGRTGFSDQDQRYLVRTISAGSLAARVSDEPILQLTTQPHFGAANLEAGLKASIWALIVVAIFMAFYYMFWGVVADFALFTNMVLILGVMALKDATFTLPGIAGIVLTIGMAVDANVLIFERIREEIDRQADLRTAVRLGYEKAIGTIIDANVTTLIICVVLGYTATAEVKGFAYTLGIGICASMFTSLFCTRVIVDIFLDATKLNKIGMLSTVVPAIRTALLPKINWIGKRYIFMATSVVLIVAGLAAVATRGDDMFDIEFLGGTQVTFKLKKGESLTMEAVEDRLARASIDEDLSTLKRGEGATVVIVGERDKTGQASEFSIATVETDAKRVGDAIKEHFADVLEIERPLHFKSDEFEADRLENAPVQAIHSTDLGEAILREDVEQEITEYLGGVVIVLDDLERPSTTEQVTDRIQRMRLQPRFADLDYRKSRVIGLERTPSPAGQEDVAYFSSMAVVSTHEQTNYVNDEERETFLEVDGLAATEWKLVRDALLRDTSLGSVSNFSPQISGEMQQSAITAMVLSLVAVVLYIWFRFGSLRYSFAAIVALVHDVTIAVGLVALAGSYFDTSIGQMLALSDFKINLALVAALLTIVGYSLNDTIVIFDRIRENRGRLAHATTQIVNDSINQTVSRTLLTSGTTFMAVLVLYLFGGSGVHGFAFAMLIGVVVGTYSSIAIAAQFLLIGHSGPEGVEGG